MRWTTASPIPALLCLAWTLTVQAQPSTPVIDAVQKGHAVGKEQAGVDAVRQALDTGGDVNEKDKTGWTPLLWSALECRPRIMVLLLEKGADPKIQSSNAKATSYMDHGHRALTLAAGCFIARRRASLAPSRGMPPAYVASELSAARDMIRSLLRKGVDPNAPDGDGRTPLMLAAMQGWEDAAQELLAAKANARAKDNNGLSAIDYAEPENVSLIGLLQKAGSPPATGRSGRTVCDAEKALDRLGYNTPIIDCIAGDQLAAVIRKFQNDKGLEQTGALDPPTRKALAIR